MSTTFFTSDLHWGHARIVELSHRPFKTLEEHDKALASNWADTVKSHDDIVWVLGDISVEGSWKHALSILKSLPGRKRLVTGNHDQAWTGKADFMKYMAAYLEVFEVVTPWARTKVNGVKVNLSHFPYEGDHTESDRFDMYRLRPSERPLIHGHVHSTERYTSFWVGQTKHEQYHVGVDAWDFKPVSMNEVAELF